MTTDSNGEEETNVIVYEEYNIDAFGQDYDSSWIHPSEIPKDVKDAMMDAKCVPAAVHRRRRPPPAASSPPPRPALAQDGGRVLLSGELRVVQPASARRGLDVGTRRFQQPRRRLELEARPAVLPVPPR